MAEDHSMIIEALRRTQAKVAFYLEPGRDHRKGLREIGAILEDERLRLALAENPTSLVADDTREEVAPAAPLSR